MLIRIAITIAITLLSSACRPASDYIVDICKLGPQRISDAEYRIDFHTDLIDVYYYHPPGCPRQEVRLDTSILDKKALNQLMMPPLIIYLRTDPL